MAKKRSRAYNPRRIWSMNLAPLVTAARDGASQAARTAGRERDRARRQSQRWRQRWLYISASGLVVAGATGAVYRVITKRQASPEEAGETGSKRGTASTADAIRSTVETSREKVTGATRNVLHRFRPDGQESPEPGNAAEQPRNQTDVTTPR